MRDRVAAFRRAPWVGRGIPGGSTGAPVGLPTARAGGARRAALEPLEARVLLSAVAGRFVFYNHSALDGDVAADARDVAAIAPGKTALLPGHAANFAIYTSYSRGINGIAIDLAAAAGGAAPGSLGPHSLIFKVGASADPATWE